MAEEWKCPEKVVAHNDLHSLAVMRCWLGGRKTMQDLKGETEELVHCRKPLPLPRAVVALRAHSTMFLAVKNELSAPRNSS